MVGITGIDLYLFLPPLTLNLGINIRRPPILVGNCLCLELDFGVGFDSGSGSRKSRKSKGSVILGSL